jgi:lipopolysaccharide transport system ATP-binding protein
MLEDTPPPAAADPAIRLRDVRKVYRLYPSVADQAIDVLGLSPVFFWRRHRYREFSALNGVNLTVARGERIGILGRNGAGKSTLLKLITGNFQPTEGTVAINGRVQALMSVGLGFHPEFSGYDNIRSSLLYNELSSDELEAAIADVVQFVELGDFLDRPVKTYSLGMRSRLEFAAATALHPEILIVDEVFGSGDAYFSAKSAQRMRGLAQSGATLLLVSHSMQQILEFCDRAIWLEEGRVVYEGPSLDTIKAYEEFTMRLRKEAAAGKHLAGSSVGGDERAVWMREHLLKQVLGSSEGNEGSRVSRWPGEGGLRIGGVRVLDEQGADAHVVRRGQRIEIELIIVAEAAGCYDCIVVILLFTGDGRWLCRHCSPSVRVDMSPGERRRVSLVYDECRLGNGEYVFSAALYADLDLDNLSTAKTYDLLARSFTFEVVDRHRDDQSVFHHPARWSGLMQDYVAC